MSLNIRSAIRLSHSILDEVIPFIEERFHLDLSELKLTVTPRDANRIGLGGLKLLSNGEIQPFIRLNLGSILNHEINGYSEYKSFNKDKTIGGFETKSKELYIRTLIIHELAHVVQFLLPRSKDNPLTIKAEYNGGYFESLGHKENSHGTFFKNIYKILRKEFVNHLVKDIGKYDPMFEIEKAGVSFMFKGQLFDLLNNQTNDVDYPIMAMLKRTGRIFKLPRIAYDY